MSLLIAGILAVGQGTVTTTRGEYHGWTDAWRLSNATVDLVVVPSIGRIMFFGPTDGENILWENAALRGKAIDPAAKDWQNFGGDKLWPAPQSEWNWPPPVALDAGPYKAEAIPNGVRLRGPEDPRFHLRFERDIMLDARGTGVQIVNRMVNVGKEPQKLTLWQIAQVDEPDYAALERRRSEGMPEGYYVYGDLPLDPTLHDLRENELRLRRNPKESRKFGGSAASGAVRAVRKGIQFRMSTRYQAGTEYPDHGSAQQIFLNADPLPYVELELANPVMELKPGARSQMVVRWTLASVPTG